MAFKKGDVSWSKGLTKETNTSLRSTSEKMKGANNPMSNPEYRRRVSEGLTGQKLSDETKWKMSESHRGVKRGPHTEESKRKISEHHKGKTKETHDYIKRQLEKMTGRTKENHSGVKRQSEIMKLKWHDPEFAKKLIASWNTKPTKPEKTIDNFLKRILPGEYELNVFGKTTLAGKIPDFVNINGKKKAIEFNGCYFHHCPKCFGGDGDKVTAERVELFKQHGWDTLVIWEYEMNDMVVVTNKILGFHDLPFISAPRQLSLFDCEVKNVI